MLDQRKYLLIASKPMDLINGYEFIFDHDNSLNKDQILVCVLGNARNQNVVTKLCKYIYQDCIQIESPDFYYSSMPYLLSLRLNRFIENFLRLFLMIIGKLLWQIRLRNIKIKGEFDYLILDCWRDKIALASKVDFKNLVIMDGGNSTNTFGLVENWIDLGPHSAIKSYLNAQNQSRPGRIRPDGVAGLFAVSATKIPKYVERKFFSKVTSVGILLFTSYSDTSIKNSIKKNKYNYSKDLVRNKKLANQIYILGYTELDFLSDQLDLAKSLQNNDQTLPVSVCIHPSDILKAETNASYGNHLKSVCNKINVESFITNYSLECDILFGNLNPPRFLVSYQSSILKWIQEVIPELHVEILEDI